MINYCTQPGSHECPFVHCCRVDTSNQQKPLIGSLERHISSYCVHVLLLLWSYGHAKGKEEASLGHDIVWRQEPFHLNRVLGFLLMWEYEVVFCKCS